MNIERKLIGKWQAYICGKRTLKEYEKMRKMFRYRKHIIAEIMMTEISYIKDLQFVMEQVIQRMNYSEEEQMKIVSSLPEIISCNQTMLDAVMEYIKEECKQGFYEEYGKPYSQIFKIMAQFLGPFKCYYQYCMEYDDKTKYREQLRKTDQHFTQIVVESEKYKEFRGLDLEGFLVKPVQRLPKYILLLKDLLKYTPKDHPDYGNILNCQKEFEKINEKNNQKMDQQIKSKQKLVELQKQQGKKHQIMEEGRLFLFEECLTLYIQPSTERSIVFYCFNDAVMLSERVIRHHGQIKYKVIVLFKFNQQSQCTIIPDSQYYKNLFKISGSNKIYIIKCNNQEERDKISQQIVSAIKKFKMQKLNAAETQYAQVTVKVEGTEEYNSASINNYTIFIISIKLEHLNWQLYLRYSEIEEIYKYIKGSQIKLNKLVRISWLKNHDNKELELRKINIENLFQSIFDGLQNHSSPEQILDKLNMPTIFFQLYNHLKSDKEQRKSISFKQDEQILNLIEQVDQSFIEELNIQDQITELQRIEDTKPVKVLLPNGEFRVFFIAQRTKAIQLCSLIAQYLKLQKFFDFRLFVTDTRSNTRPLDNNQVVINSLPNDPQIFGDDGFINKSKIVLNQIFDESYIFEFKKYLFLPQPYESLAYKVDPIRLEIIVQSIFNGIKKQNYNYYLEQYACYYSLYLFVHHTEKELEEIKQGIKPILLDIRKIIKKSEIKGETKSEWKKLVYKYFNEQYIKILTQRNKNKLTYEYKQACNSVQPDIYLSHNHLARLSLINYAYKFPLCGVTLFYVGVSDTSINAIKQFIRQQLPNLYIGIAYNKILFISPGRKQILNTFQFSSLINIIVEPLYIVFQCMCDDLDYSFRFKSLDGYRINKLINDYKTIQQILG